MNMAVVGAARVQFGADTSDFDVAAREVQSTLQKVVDKFHDFEAQVRKVGAGLTLAITVPFAGMVRAVDRGAGAFEAQMKRVEAALDNVSGDQLKTLSQQARNLGPAVGKSATEAAEGIEDLGLAGVSTADILGGGLKATLDLATAGMVQVAPAAGLVTDVMGQFKKTAEDLPRVVTNVVGTLDASKFGFQDFADAIAQGGGVAASAGISFTDFATAIAATSTQFSSGSDAGTSFKTYIQSLVGNSDDAKYAMKQLGLEFFDAQGRMKPLAAQAEMLNKALGDLDDHTRTDALKRIFGSDAARTAIGLMQQGKQGFEDLQATVEGGDVEAKIAKRMEGAAAASTRISNAWESVKIALGDTGLLDAITAVKNMFAAMLESVAKAPPALLKVGAVFAALAAAIGPLVLVLGSVGTFLLAKFVRGFGLLGNAVSLIIAPISTLVEWIGTAGLMRALGMAARAFLGLSSPIGWAIAAFVLFKDSIIPVLEQFWNKLTATLGPPLTAIMEKVQGLFGAVANGPIGSAINAVIGFLLGLKDVIGTVLAGALTVVGEIIIRVLNAAIAALSGFVDVVRGVVDIISALLTGDFAGVWNGILEVLDGVFGGIVDMAAALVPELAAQLQLVYEAAKAWLGDGFSAVADWFTSTVKSAVDYVASAFPNVVAAAKSVYQGVKQWLVDKFGALLGWIGTAAKWIGDKYQALKERLGLGGADDGAANDNPAPPKPKEAPEPPRPTRTVNLDKPDKTRSKHSRARRQTAEEIRTQTELEAARLRGDLQAEQVLRDKLDLQKQTEAYQRTGLSLDRARAAAMRDMKDIQAARAVAAAREIAAEQEKVALDVAHLDQNRALEDSLGRQAELKRRIAFYYAETRDLAEATRLAEADQEKVDAARDRVRARWFTDDAQDRAVRLAQLRGDTDEEVRQLQRLIDIRKRARELEDEGLDPSDAMKRATQEWDEEDQARLTGVFRSTFKDGMRAALDGDLSSFVKNWWKDRVAKGMEQALNSLSDLIARLFSKVGNRNSGGGGGILGAISSVVGSIFGGGGGATLANPGTGGVNVGSIATDIKFPGFKTGGSFKVGGMSGVDANLVQFRASKGEIVDIHRGDNDNGPNGVVYVNMPIHFSGAIDLATKAEAARFAEAARQSAIQGVMEAQRRRG